MDTKSIKELVDFFDTKSQSTQSTPRNNANIQKKYEVHLIPPVQLTSPRVYSNRELLNSPKSSEGSPRVDNLDLIEIPNNIKIKLLNKSGYIESDPTISIRSPRTLTTPKTSRRLSTDFNYVSPIDKIENKSKELRKIVLSKHKSVGNLY